MLLKDATVLIVDDEAGLLEVFRAWMEREGARVMTAEDGQQGLDAATRERVDLIISDVRMPVMSGIEMARRLNANAQYLPKVAFVSGFSDISERECYDIGVHVALNKPLRRGQLVAAATRCLMDREEAWSVPPAAAPERGVTARFASVAEARRQGQIAFGRGGFCLRGKSPAPVNEAISLDLAFDSDNHAVRGAGLVRWNEPAEAQIGIEITYVDDANRAWAAALLGDSGSTAFIPRASQG